MLLWPSPTSSVSAASQHFPAHALQVSLQTPALGCSPRSCPLSPALTRASLPLFPTLSSVSFFPVTSSSSGSRDLSGEHGFSSCCAQEPPACAFIQAPLGTSRTFFPQGFIFCFPPTSAKGSWEKGANKGLTLTLHLQADPAHSSSGASPQQPHSQGLGAGLDPDG